jgi:bifunctional UDP-N-acetylglucosamine pyrophosphorylase/glucosamine-1-phosphate N-acetyltransferase
MQAVILAAGRGSRMGKLTEASPKPMLEVTGKTLIEHKLDALPKEVDEIILVVGYMGSVVQQYFGGFYKDKKIFYVEQENPAGGTAEAVWLCRELLHDRFLVMNGDNIYGSEDIRACADSPDWAVLVKENQRIRTGRVLVNDGGCVTGIAENSEHDGEIGNANTGLYALDTRLFEYQPIPKAPGSAELGLPQTMMQAVGQVDIHAIPATFWIEIKNPEDLQKAEEILKKRA